MHERERMNQFDRRRRRVELRFRNAQALSGGINQQWAHPLATVEDRVAHCFVQADRFDLTTRHHGVELRLDPAGVVRDALFEVVCHLRSLAINRPCSLHFFRSRGATESGL